MLVLFLSLVLFCPSVSPSLSSYCPHDVYFHVKTLHEPVLTPSIPPSLCMQANPDRMVVVSLSLGAAFSQTVNTAVDSLTRLGIPSVVAAGNSNIDASQSSPASSLGAITVGATGKTDLKECKLLVVFCVSV